MLIGVFLFFGAIIGFKLFVLQMEKKMSVSLRNPVVTVSATPAVNASWTSSLSVVGSTRTVQGVNVTTELPGMITDIYFTPGASVKQGDILVKLDIAPDIAKLHELQAKAQIAKITYFRDKKQYSFGAVSKEQLDTDDANMKVTAALVEEQKATIDKKIIRAPFTGRLGISEVNPGQYLNSGDGVTSLQTLDPIYVDFYLPEQAIQAVAVGQTVSVTTDRAPGRTFAGKITTINPIVDTNIRNIEVEATLQNSDEVLLPGMFTNVQLSVGAAHQFITLPNLAVTFNPYGALVYILQKTTAMQGNQPIWKATEQFVETGEMRGNQIAILRGVKPGDVVVTSGQLKIKNNSLVVINNSIAPSDNANPVVQGR